MKVEFSTIGFPLPHTALTGGYFLSLTFLPQHDMMNLPQGKDVPAMKKILALTAVLMILFPLNACGRSEAVETAPPVTPPTAAQTIPATEPTVPPTQAETMPALSFVEVWREGEVSRIPVETVRGTVGPYAIAMDPEYFTFIPQETVDLFAYESWPGDEAVYYAVSNYEGGYDPEQFIADIRAQFETDYESWYSEETTIGQYPATLVCLERNLEAPAYYRQIFLVDCSDTRYVIETQFYVEMFEGLCAIMRALFDTFTPI